MDSLSFTVIDKKCKILNGEVSPLQRCTIVNKIFGVIDKLVCKTEQRENERIKWSLRAVY